MDNLRVHKKSIIRRLLNKCGALLRFPPAYSPDLNPVEKMWSKIPRAMGYRNGGVVEKVMRWCQSFWT
jgi:transposase